MKRTLITALTVMMLACGSSRNEPPFNFGSVGAGGKARSLELSAIRGDPPNIVYQVTYPGTNLKSEATLELAYRALLNEVFDGKWLVTYEYENLPAKVQRIPSLISIASDSRDSFKGRLLNQYHLVKVVPIKGGLYRDLYGRTKLIPLEYFEVIPIKGPPPY